MFAKEESRHDGGKGYLQLNGDRGGRNMDRAHAEIEKAEMHRAHGEGERQQPPDLPARRQPDDRQQQQGGDAEADGAKEDRMEILDPDLGSDEVQAPDQLADQHQGDMLRLHDPFLASHQAPGPTGWATACGRRSTMMARPARVTTVPMIRRGVSGSPSSAIATAAPKTGSVKVKGITCDIG